MRTTFTICFLFFTTLLLQSQPALIWQKSYGGSDHEYAWKTIPTSDGGFAFVGYSDSNNGDVSGNHGGTDLWVAKLDSDGNIQWSKLYGGTQDDEGYDIIQTADNGFMIAGWSDSDDGDITDHHGPNYYSDIWVLKLTSSGDISWSKSFGGTDDEEVSSMVQTQDGNFYLCGDTYSNDGDVSGNHSEYYTDVWIIKISSSGTVMNQICIGGSDYEEGINLVLTADNGCIAGGRTSSTDGDATGYHGGTDMIIAKLTSSLVLEWAKCFGGSETEECNSILQMSDGSYAALGYTSTHNNGDVTGHHGSQGSDDFWLLKLTSAGLLSSAKCYGGDGDDQANALIQTLDGGFVMSGLTNSTNGDVTGFHPGSFFDPDTWVIKVNATGTLLWQRCCGGSGQDESFNLYEESNGVYVVTGFTYSSNYDVTENFGSADGWIFKISATTGINETSNHAFEIFPNPCHDYLIVPDFKNCTFKITDLTGKSILAGDLLNKGTIDLSEISEGLYFITLTTMEKNLTSKIIVKHKG